jgi:hypothetical protein
MEGFEPRVLAGARGLLKGENPPAICLEWNPTAMAEITTSGQALGEMLAEFHFFHVDDFERQRRPIASEIGVLQEVPFVCNVIAVPRQYQGRWTATERLISSR